MLVSHSPGPNQNPAQYVTVPYHRLRREVPVPNQNHYNDCSSDSSSESGSDGEPMTGQVVVKAVRKMRTKTPKLSLDPPRRDSGPARDPALAPPPPNAAGARQTNQIVVPMHTAVRAPPIVSSLHPVVRPPPPRHQVSLHCTPKHDTLWVFIFY
jgi:hypothetical protein